MKEGRKIPIIKLVRIAVIAALYFVLTAFVEGLSFGPLQFRVAEAMSLLPLIFPEAVLGLTLGCFLANIFSPFAWDMLIGTLATLVSALGTYLIGRIWKKGKLWAKCLVGAIPPIVINALVIPAMWFFLGTEEVYWINVAFIFATQTGTIIPLGTVLVLAINKIPTLNGKNY